jgi:hypothetical protein
MSEGWQASGTGMEILTGAKMPLQIGAGAILAVKRFQFLKTENKA